MQHFLAHHWMCTTFLIQIQLHGSVVFSIWEALRVWWGGRILHQGAWKWQPPTSPFQHWRANAEIPGQNHSLPHVCQESWPSGRMHIDVEIRQYYLSGRWARSWGCPVGHGFSPWGTHDCGCKRPVCPHQWGGIFFQYWHCIPSSTCSNCILLATCHHEISILNHSPLTFWLLWILGLNWSLQPVRLPGQKTSSVSTSTRYWTSQQKSETWLVTFKRITLRMTRRWRS